MNRYRVVLALTLLGVAMGSVRLLMAAATVPPLFTGNDQVGTQFAPNPSFIGVTDFQMGTSTPTETPVLFLSGSGLLYNIECSSGSLGSFARLFDTVRTATTGNSTVSMDSDKLALGPTVISQGVLDSAKVTTVGGNALGSWNPQWPRHFATGLVMIKRKGNSPTTSGDTGSNISCSVGARLDTGTNP